MKAHSKETQDTMTPEKALLYLKEGNVRFQNNLKANRNLLQQVNDLREGQFPFATILSCIDSRTSAEIIFDQGLGDIFSIRLPGNFVNEDVLGSLEFACKVAGSKLIVVLGHKKCGAIKGAYENFHMGHFTQVLARLRPAVYAVKEKGIQGLSESEILNEISKENVVQACESIVERSYIIQDLLDKGHIGLVGAMYDVETGLVEFYKDTKVNIAQQK